MTKHVPVGTPLQRVLHGSEIDNTLGERIDIDRERRL